MRDLIVLSYRGLALVCYLAHLFGRVPLCVQRWLYHRPPSSIISRITVRAIICGLECILPRWGSPACGYATQHYGNAVMRTSSKEAWSDIIIYLLCILHDDHNRQKVTWAMVGFLAELCLSSTFHTYLSYTESRLKETGRLHLAVLVAKSARWPAFLIQDNLKLN